MQNVQNQITKKQHHVPQFYLKKFVNSVGKLERLDCEKRKLVVARAPKSVCGEDFFYSENGDLDEVSQTMEKDFQRIESEIAFVYDKVAKKFTDFQEITFDDKMIVATFMSMQYLRGPYMRSQIKRIDEDMTKQITRIRYSSDNIHDSLDKIEKETNEKISKINNVPHLQMLGEMEGFRNSFFNKEWTVYISKSTKKFITSDNPIAELFPERTEKFCYGPSFLQRTHFFAMTPDILIVASHPKSDVGNKVKRKTLFDDKIDNDKILELNFEFVRKATAYSYASSKIFLQDIIDSANLFDEQKKERQGVIIRAVV